uniref:Uncharacterized protein n=1 Tax=Sphenodon punctatus TaxID=8508 RepID=A0A8D0L8R8_SPHPU
MSEFWLCFNCCIAEQPQPKRRRRIDRSMIGSGDLFSGMNSVSVCVYVQRKFSVGTNTSLQHAYITTKGG